VCPLHYTGHPIFDVGLATITACSQNLPSCSVSSPVEGSERKSALAYLTRGTPETNSGEPKN
jgi:hypothetical protein